jgi:predicted ester cyclase
MTHSTASTLRTPRRSLLVALGVGSLLASSVAAATAETCSSPSGSNEYSALLGRYIAAYNAHDTSSFGEIFTTTYWQRSGRNPPGLVAHIENARRLFAALPDLHLVVEDRIFGGEKIVARCLYTGTQRGRFLGVEPTGKEIKFGTIDIWRVENGKLAEHWDQVDFAGILQQLRSP